MHSFHSDKVLAGQGYPTLRSSHAERTRNGHPSGAVDPEATTSSERRFEMKTIFLALALAFAFATPSMAVEFNNTTVHAFGR